MIPWYMWAVICASLALFGWSQWLYYIAARDERIAHERAMQRSRGEP